MSLLYNYKKYLYRQRWHFYIITKTQEKQRHSHTSADKECCTVILNKNHYICKVNQMI